MGASHAGCGSSRRLRRRPVRVSGPGTDGGARLGYNAVRARRALARLVPAVFGVPPPWEGSPSWTLP